jgi:adenosine deaminase
MPTDPEFIRLMPKVELHVHIEGSIRPETLLKLAKKNGVDLPADNVEGLRHWYEFRDFAHFVEVYLAITRTIKNPEDIELLVKEFLEGQYEQNILHTEATYTASTIEKYIGIPWSEQLDALQRARQYGERQLGVTSDFIIDIVRGQTAERAMDSARWAVAAHGSGVCALGLAGEEGRGTSSEYVEAFEFAHANSVPVVPHAGETQGAWSIVECLRDCKPQRIGHGVQCMQDQGLVERLVDEKITLEVCPSSNVCLSVFPAFEEHPLPKMIDAGLCVTINSDDPPMFNTSLTQEFEKCAATFGFSEGLLRELSARANRASFAPETRKAEIAQKMLDF